MSEINSPSRRLGKKGKGKRKKAPLNVDQNAHHRHLPFEIWALVFSYLPSGDLTRVARVSTTFLPICRPAIYRTLTLRNDNQSYPYTFNVLKHINSLASSVRHATFFTVWTPWMPGVPPTTWLDFDIFARMTGLRTLTFIGCPFMLEEEQTKFVEMIRMWCPALKGFTYVPHYPTAFPSPSFEIRGLESVSWPNYLASSPEPQCVSLLMASANTLTSLSFPTCPGYPIAKRPSDTDTWTTLLGLHFPNLTSCHIGLLYPDRLTLRTRGDTTETLTAFLAAHPRLTQVALGCSTQVAHVYEGISGAGERVAPGFLPALRSLETHPANAAIMVRGGVRALQAQLTRLVLAYYCPPDAGHSGAVVELLLALEGSAGFPFVEELGVYFSGAFDEIESVALQWVHKLGAYFPAVLSWSGHLGVVSPWSLAEALAPYNLVKSVHLPYTTLDAMRTDGALSADDFVPIANACPQLTALTIKTHLHQVQGVKHVFNRNEDGVLLSITVNAAV